jgi:hypothetical protein
MQATACSSVSIRRIDLMPIRRIGFGFKDELLQNFLDFMVSFSIYISSGAMLAAVGLGLIGAGQTGAATCSLDSGQRRPDWAWRNGRRQLSRSAFFGETRRAVSCLGFLCVSDHRLSQKIHNLFT